jgi:hypothetical protein
VILSLLIGGGGWFGFRSDWLAGARSPEARLAQTPETTIPTTNPMTASPPTVHAPAPTEPPETVDDLGVESAAATVAVASPTPGACTQRVRIDNVQINPSATVAPGASVIVYVSLRNSGSCAWPAGVSFDLIANPGDIPSPTSFPVTTLAPDETIQFLIPMTAPEELGAYEMSWELQMGDGPLGRGESGLVTYQVIVDDVDDVPEPPVAAEVIVAATPPAALDVLSPTLLSWEMLPAQGLWRGTVALTVTGGTGAHRIYQNRISAETEVVSDVVTIESPHCRPAPVELWILSGSDILNWTGTIVPPPLMGCP